LWGQASRSCGRWPSKNLTGISLPVNADIPTDIQVHFVDEFDAHASPTSARGIGELGATDVAAAVANAVYDAGRRVSPGACPNSRSRDEMAACVPSA
jgi:CO/xanthine dehydrogenase Mo-binding subunit